MRIIEGELLSKMLWKIGKASRVLFEAVERLGECEKQLLTVSNPFSDPRFELCGTFRPYILEGARRLFARRFLTAIQLPENKYREISYFDWQDEVTAYLILAEGFYIYEDPFTKKRDKKRHDIFVSMQSLEGDELQKMFALIVSESRPLGDEHSLFENLGNLVMGEFNPADPGIPKWGLRLCDAYDWYHRKRWSGHLTLEQFATSLVQALNRNSKSGVLKEQFAGSELLRRRSISCREFRQVLSRGEVNVFVRSANTTDPVVVPSVLWWVTRELDDVLQHHIIHADREDRLSVYNGAAPFVDAQGFSQWLKGSKTAASSTGPGRRRGTRQYPGDEALAREICDLLDRGEVGSFAAGFQRVEARVEGSSSSDANKKRLYRLVRKMRELE